VSQTGTSTRNGRLTKVVALLLVGVGVAVVAGVSWQWIGRVRYAAAQQAELDRVLTEQWGGAVSGARAAGAARAGADPARANPARANPARANPARHAPAARPESDAAAPGTPIARLHLPTLDLALVVVEGTADAQLDKAPGRLAGTQRLGSPGNTVVAGHRYPGLFWDLDRLAAGDPVVLEMADTWLVYRTVRTVIVEPHDRTVVAPPAPDQPTLLTLATCEPKLSTAQRLVKQAELIRTEPRGGERPRELSARSRR